MAIMVSPLLLPYVWVLGLIALTDVTGFSLRFTAPITEPANITKSESKNVKEDVEHVKIVQGVGEEGCRLPSPSKINTYPFPLQMAIFLGMYGLLFSGSWLLVALFEMLETSTLLGDVYRGWQMTWIPLFGILFSIAGTLHFSLKQEFQNIFPYQGAWGIWYIPGSAAFHVRWTGIAESLGGLWLLAAYVSSIFDFSIHDETSMISAILSPSSPALALMLLVLLMTPANIFSFTHGARLPRSGPKLPMSFHATRGLIQCLLIAMLYELALPSILSLEHVLIM